MFLNCNLDQPLEIAAMKMGGCRYGNMALETVLFGEPYFNPAVKWGVAARGAAPCQSASYLTG